MPLLPENPLFAQYKLECTHPTCKGRAIIKQAHSAGLKVGDMVPPDPADFNFARCPQCRRTMMKVVEAPPPPPSPPIKGFTKIPTE